MKRKRGSLSNIVRVFIQNNTLTTGKGLTGLAYNSTNLQISVMREFDAAPTLYTGANIETITTIGTFQQPSTSAKCRFKEIDATNRPGEYEIHFHDDAGHFGSGDLSKNVQIRVDEITTTALNIAPCLREIDLVAYNEQDATALGLTNFDAAITTRSSHSAADVAALILVDPANDKIDGSKITGVSGILASQAEVLAIQNNTRVRVIVPAIMERPDTGSTAFKLWLYLYDEIGNMEAPDELPTITAKNQTGVDRSGNLGVVTLEATGSYSVTYTLSSTDSIEQLLYEWSIVEGGNTRKHGAASQVVDTTAVDFTTEDRANLASILEDTGTTLPATIGSPMQAGTKVTLSDATEEQIDDIQDALYNGKWVIDPTAKTLTLYKADGVTVLKVIDLTSTSEVIPTFIQGVPQ